MRKLILLTAALFVAMLPVRAKRPLTMLTSTDGRKWRIIPSPTMGNGQRMLSTHRRGDGKLYFYDTAKGNVIEIKRGYAPKFSSNGKWAFALVKPFFNDTRKAKINKKRVSTFLRIPLPS